MEPAQARPWKPTPYAVGAGSVKVMGVMFLRCHKRNKDGKQLRYWSVVENQRLRSGKVSQRTVLYLGDLNDQQRAAWRKSLDMLDENTASTDQYYLFPDDREIPEEVANGLRVKLSAMELHRPRPFGNCWLGCELWDTLELGRFWKELLPKGREHVPWPVVLELLVVNRLVEPGAEWWVHRHWFRESAMDELLGEDAAVAAKNRLYECLDLLLEHREALFRHLKERWSALFGVKYEVLLYDLTSTYFESPKEESDLAQYGYSRDKRSDCKQVVIALIITPEGFPLAYEVMPGNTSDRTTLPAFMAKIHELYGRAERIWIMDRGIPTENQLQDLKAAQPPVNYLAGTPRAQLRKYEKQLTDLPWQKIRDSVEVKLFREENELYVLARSEGRQAKERAMRRRKLARLLRTLRQLRKSRKNVLPRDQFLQRLGAAKSKAGRARGYVDMTLPAEGQPVDRQTFTFRLNKEKLKGAEFRDGHYLLRSNLSGDDPAKLWELYMQLVEIEAAFKSLKSDLVMRPIHHQLDHRILAHIFVCFMAYGLQVTLKKRLKKHASGLTPRAVLEKLATILMLEVHLPIEDGRKLILPRYTHPEKEHLLLLEKLNLTLPKQPPPRIRSAQAPSASPVL